MSNPLLDFSGLPRFADFQTEYVTTAIDALLKENRTLLEQVRSDRQPVTWQNFVQPMVDANERLSRAWGQVSHLNAVMNNLQLREVYNQNLPLITQFYAELSQDLALFEKFKLVISLNGLLPSPALLPKIKYFPPSKPGLWVIY